MRIIRLILAAGNSQTGFSRFPLRQMEQENSISRSHSLFVSKTRFFLGNKNKRLGKPFYFIGGLSAREFPPGFIFDLTVQRDRPYTFRTLCLISLNLHTHFRFSYFSQKPPVYIIFVDWSLRLACPVTEALSVVCNISSAGPSRFGIYKYKFQGKTLDPTPLRILLHLYLPFDCALSIFKKKKNSLCAKMAVNWIG